jgi:hypothetical protein
MLGVKYGVKQSRQLDMWRDVAESCCWWWAYDNYVVVSERPTFVGMEPQSGSRYRLHCVDGPAITFADGWQVHALHGVRVPGWLVETKDTNIDPKRVSEFVNAEQRREFVRKVGVERIMQACGATVADRVGDYELVLLDVGDKRQRPYLKMRNPSIGVWHVEGVAPEIRTVEAALAWRNQTTETPLALT